MKDNFKIKILRSIGNVYEKAKGSNLTDELFANIDSELSILSDYFRLTKIQSFFLSLIFAHNYRGDTVDLNDLIEFLCCNPMKILEFSDELDVLQSKRMLKRIKSRHRISIARTNDQYIISEEITKAVLNNLPIPVLDCKRFDNVLDVLEQIFKLCEQRENDELTSDDLFEQILEILNTNKKFKLIQTISKLNLDISNTVFFIICLWKAITGYEQIDIERTLEHIFDKASDKADYTQKILTGSNVLVVNKLIEIIEARFINDTEVRLTNKSISIIEESGLRITGKKLKNDNLIDPKKIVNKPLYYNSEENKQIEMLADLLTEKKLGEIQNRLTNRGLPIGITILLHGTAGTGKTETVYQLARQTGREIMKVDISQSKSMWFGESEKVIKRIFTDYRNFAKQSKKTPILLFNEADAIISKRKDSSSTNVAQTENAIQNIILEELENFQGILFATTNLVNNIDTAFERRFLFKVQFEKPDSSVKAKIWKSKLKGYKPQDYIKLSAQFDFSGGQIDNVVRKAEMYEVLNGQKASLNQIMEYCDNEILYKSNRVPVGFIKTKSHVEKRSY